MIPADSWDFDVTQPMVLADLRIHGRKRKVIMQAPKHGFFYVIDRTNGKVISTGKFCGSQTTSRATSTPRTGRPVLLPTANYDTEPRLITPNGPFGAHSWQPISYNPRTGTGVFPGDGRP